MRRRERALEVRSGDDGHAGGELVKTGEAEQEKRDRDGEPAEAGEDPRSDAFGVIARHGF
jgi:hypothetical protein